MNSDPLIRLVVPIKQGLTISGEIPMISYSCAPRYEAILEKDTKFDSKKGYNKFGRKLQALYLALQEFSEVLLLDWYCFILKPFDKNFYDSLK